MQPTTSALILQYLETHPLTPPRVIAKSLSLTITDVRYHLQNMIKTGQVEWIRIETTGNRGRPARLYRLPLECDSHALSVLANGLLETILVSEMPNPLQNLASRILPQDLQKASPQAVRITRAIQYLNTIGYDARWEARPHQPLVEFRRCPFAALSKESSRYCQIDQALLETAIGCRVVPAQIRNTDDQTSCMMEIHLDEAIPANPDR